MRAKTKLIRVNIDICTRLDEFRVGHESYSDSICRILQRNKQLEKLQQIMEQPQ